MTVFSTIVYRRRVTRGAVSTTAKAGQTDGKFDNFYTGPPSSGVREKSMESRRKRTVLRMEILSSFTPLPAKTAATIARITMRKLDFQQKKKRNAQNICHSVSLPVSRWVGQTELRSDLSFPSVTLSRRFGIARVNSVLGAKSRTRGYLLRKRFYFHQKSTVLRVVGICEKT